MSVFYSSKSTVRVIKPRYTYDIVRNGERLATLVSDSMAAHAVYLVVVSVMRLPVLSIVCDVNA